MLNLSLSSIMAGLIFGSIGLWLMRAGKSKGDVRIIVIGVLLMVYSYIMPNVWFDWGIGCSLCYLAYHIWN